MVIPFMILILENLNVQELSVQDQMEIDGGVWPLIIAAGYIYGKSQCECE